MKKVRATVLSLTTESIKPDQVEDLGAGGTRIWSTASNGRPYSAQRWFGASEGQNWYDEPRLQYEASGPIDEAECASWKPAILLLQEGSVCSSVKSREDREKVLLFPGLWSKFGSTTAGTKNFGKFRVAGVIYKRFP